MIPPARADLGAQVVDTKSILYLGNVDLNLFKAIHGCQKLRETSPATFVNFWTITARR